MNTRPGPMCVASKQRILLGNRLPHLFIEGHQLVESRKIRRIFLKIAHTGKVQNNHFERCISCPFSGKNSRERRYNRLDLEALNGRKQVRNHPLTEISGALHWGVPLLDSALTLISDGKLYYRGIEVDRLASERTFWEVAGWFWTGNWDCQAPLAPPGEKGQVRSPFAAIQNDLIRASENDPLGYDFSLPALTETGGKILQLFLSKLSAGQGADLNSAGQILHRAWCGGYPGADRLLNAALILCIDHELNASSFTARVTAAAGCNLYEVVSASLCALHGARHGGHVFRAALLLEELEKARSLPDFVL
jgi:citrate synthase